MIIGESLRVVMKVFVHRTAEVSAEATVGDGTFIWNEAQVRERAKIGRNCRLGKSVYIDKNVSVGNDCKIQNFATIYDGVTIGNRVFVGPHACFTNDIRPRASSTDWEIVPTVVRDGATIGANATILCGITIGKNAMIGAGAVVTGDVPDHGLVVGNPARLIGYVCDQGHKLNKSFWCKDCGKRIMVNTVGRRKLRKRVRTR